MNWLYDKISSAIAEWIAKNEDKERIGEANKAIKEKLLAAKTKDETKDAIRDLINRL